MRYHVFVYKTLSANWRRTLARLLAAAIVSLTMGWLQAQAAITAPQPLSAIQGLSASQVSSLQRAGITSLAALSESKPQTLMKLLKLTEKQSKSVIAQAAQERVKLNSKYYELRNRFKLPPIKLPGSYASLITPTNECTILVRHVCGLENQCGTSPGCEVSMTLLQRYNATTTDLDRVHLAESCLMALQDQTLFPQCGP